MPEVNVLHVIHVHRINQFSIVVFTDEDLQNVGFGIEVCCNWTLAEAAMASECRRTIRSTSLDNAGIAALEQRPGATSSSPDGLPRAGNV
uniref:Uncharacterized protein n=1 Tax=Romanomermis culicivorax TaxID=13658 RepID=A0A915IPF7_ROMCU